MSLNNPNENDIEQKTDSQKIEAKSLGLFSSLKKGPEDYSQSNDSGLEEEPIGIQESNEDGEDKEPLLTKKQRQLKDRNQDNQLIKRNRMGMVTSYFAIIKGYTTINIFILPIGFKDGGWLFTPIILIFAAFFECICAILLTQAARKTGIYVYTDLVEFAFGKPFRIFIQILLAILCFECTLSPLIFFIKTLQSMVHICTGETISIWVFGAITAVVFAPILWIRTIETFKFGFIYACLVIVFTVAVISTIDVIEIEDHDDNAGPNWQPFNENNYWTAVGLAFFMFEGIANVLPVMEASEVKESFTCLIIAALSTLLVINIAFSELCYYTFGSDLKEPIIIQQMPEYNPWVITAKILFASIILVSVPLIIYNTNQIAEFWIFRKMQYSETRKWLKNLSRTIILIISIILAITYYYHLHQILGFSGVVLGSILVIITPALVHNKLVADTTCMRFSNYALMVYGVATTLIIGTMLLVNWNNKE